MCAVDFDPPAFLSRTWRRSRKVWRCDECWFRFETGSRYLYTVGKWEGSISSFRHCERCCELGQLAEAAECSWSYGNLLDDVKQTIDPHGWHTDADPAVLGRICGLLWRLNEDRLASNDVQRAG